MTCILQIAAAGKEDSAAIIDALDIETINNWFYSRGLPGAVMLSPPRLSTDLVSSFFFLQESMLVYGPCVNCVRARG